MLVKINDNSRSRAVNDLLDVYYSDRYINEKGYLQKLIDLLFNLGYYDNNKTLFQKG